MFGRERKKNPVAADSSDGTLNDGVLGQPSKAQIKRATRTRLCWSLFSSFLFLISVVFVVLVEIGNLNVNTTLDRIYFININVADIVPVQVPDAILINSIAQTLGLHDFYQVGLWGFCQGYNGQGVTSCSSPQTLYWFNPVEILQSQLLAGATIALPTKVDTILDLIRIVSHVMFGLFLTAACLNFILIFVVPLSVYSRWWNALITIFVFLGALFMTAAAVIATVMFIIMQRAITSATRLNIQATIGVEMFAFMWVAAATSVIAFLVHMGMCCCCASRRDVRTGRKRGSKKAWQTEAVGVSETSTREKRKMPIFGRTSREKRI